MSILKATLMSAAFVLGSASVAYAQDSMTDKAKDMAVDKATDMAKDKAKDAVGEKASGMVDPAAKMGKNMMKGDSLKDAAMKMGTSEVKSMGNASVVGGTDVGGMTDTSLSGDEAMTAGKVIMGGGSTEDAAMAVAKKRAKDQMMDKAEGMITQTIGGGKVVTGDAVIDSSTVVATDPDGVVPPVKATVTTTTTPAITTTMAPAQAAPAMAVNCPSGTTSQPNGTCMITGDYKGK